VECYRAEVAVSEYTPATTYALVVGIEEYEASNIKDLNGQAADARRFVDWLHVQGVPDSQILLFLSPVEANKGLLDQPGPAAQPATQALIRDAITRVLPAAKGNLLFLFWAGHGVISADGTRKLFYKDGTEKDLRSLDLNALLTSLRSDIYPSFKRQVGIVDACANYVEGVGLPASVPSDVFPAGSPLVGHEQFVMLGAREGERAKSSAERQTGWFAEAVLERLPAAGAEAWPPDMKALAEQLATHFSTLRAAGKVKQTPAFFRYRDWDSSEVSFGQMKSAVSVAAPAAPASKRSLTPKEKNELVKALLASAIVQNDLNVVLEQIRPEVTWKIPTSRVPQAYMFNIVNTCLSYSGAMEELIEAVRIYEGGSNEMQRIDEVARSLGLLP
jgi:hypothetical protein